MQGTVVSPAPPRSLIDRLAARLRVSPSFVRFILVGVVSYGVAQAVLLLLYDVLPLLPRKDRELDFGLFSHPDVRLLIASMVAVECAIIFKFFAHEHWTFRDRPQRGWIVLRFLKFNASCIASPIVVVLTVNVLTPTFGISPYVSNTIGTGLGFIANWAFSAYLIWPHRSRIEQADPAAPVAGPR
jgi:putative flippase GtrA